MLKTACAIIFSLFSMLFTMQFAHAVSPGQSGNGGGQGAERASKKNVTAKKKTAKKTTKKTTKKAAAKKRTNNRTRVAQAKNKRTAKPRTKMARKVVTVRGKRKVVYVAYSPERPVASVGDRVGLNKTRDPLDLKSNAAYVLDQASAQVLLEKNAGVALPIASITKLMTALVVLDAHQNLHEILEVTNDDIDREKHSFSRLRIGSRLKRSDMLHIALMSSENRAASALGRNYPGGLPAFVAAMNAKARSLGMHDTHYSDSSGLSSRNVSSARDLAKLVIVASRYQLIRDYSTDTQAVIDTGRHMQQYANTNRLVRNPEWKIGVQKTGYITEAGRCLVMQAKIKGRDVVMVFLDSKGKMSRIGDASRVRNWLVSHKFDAGLDRNNQQTQAEESVPVVQNVPQETFLGIPES